MTLTVETISLKEAELVLDACEKKAIEIKHPMQIAVVDAGGHLVAHKRMDGAWLGSADIAINKAFTARSFDIATGDLAKESQPERQFYGIHNTNNARIIIFAGGFPLIKNGKVVGAVGVSGGTKEQDSQVAEAGKKVFEKAF